MSRTCLFCNADEACFVEIVCWDPLRQRARELLLQGLCTMHASDTDVHPKDPEMRILHPGLEHRRETLALRHFAQFPGNVLEGTSDPTLRFGQRYFRLDSPEGAMIRAARGGHVDKTKAAVGGPADEIEIERVPPLASGQADLPALAEIVRDAAAAGDDDT